MRASYEAELARLRAAVAAGGNGGLGATSTSSAGGEHSDAAVQVSDAEGGGEVVPHDTPGVAATDAAAVAAAAAAASEAVAAATAEVERTRAQAAAEIAVREHEWSARLAESQRRADEAAAKARDETATRVLEEV